MLIRRRFWWRRWHLVLSYALLAIGAWGIALIAGYVLLLTLMHMVHRGW